MGNTVKRTFRIKWIAMLLLTAATMTYIGFTPTDNEAAQVLSRYGSRSEEVRQIQLRLRDAGFYKGSIDGIFGSQTLAAVKSYQADRGLTVDGIVGPQTLAKLGLSTGSTGNRSNDLNLLARVISAEARGEPYSGQVAVGNVIMNRIKHPSFPNTLAGIIYQPGAFTCVADGQINLPAEESAIRAAQDAMNGVSVVGSAIYYYNPSTATNAWIRSRPIVKTIGEHVFCQ